MCTFYLDTSPLSHLFYVRISEMDKLQRWPFSQKSPRSSSSWEIFIFLKILKKIIQRSNHSKRNPIDIKSCTTFVFLSFFPRPY